ncbi:MAG: hypothetical protein JO036_14035 [Candidatus Eremiobacteraeota bacterium]|nr:hypothetical protein [Candidatus Eremiobacteraeota bacterium]
MFALAVLLALASTPPAITPVSGTVAGNVVVLTPADAVHRTLRVLLDTGGFDLIESDAVTRFGLERVPIELRSGRRETVVFPDWIGTSFPPPATRWLVARPNALRDGFAAPVDATLGPAYLLEHTLTVDYPHRTIALGTPPDGGAAVPLTLAVGRPAAEGVPPEVYALVGVNVAGEALTMLLDTGATARVRDAVKRSVEDGEPIHQVCLIESAVLQRWHRAHPRWTFMESAFDVAGDRDGSASAAILVPELRIGDLRAPPTWFVERRDASTFAALSKAFGKPVSGDLGGDALRRWRVTFDLHGERLLLR